MEAPLVFDGFEDFGLQIAEINGGYAFKSQQYTELGIRVIRISDL